MKEGSQVMDVGLKEMLFSFLGVIGKQISLEIEGFGLLLKKKGTGTSIPLNRSCNIRVYSASMCSSLHFFCMLPLCSKLNSNMEHRSRELLFGEESTLNSGAMILSLFSNLKTMLGSRSGETFSLDLLLEADTLF